MAPHTAGLQSADLLTGGAMCDMLMPAIAAHLLPWMILLTTYVHVLATMSQCTVSGPPVATQTAEHSTKYIFRAPVCRVANQTACQQCLQETAMLSGADARCDSRERRTRRCTRVHIYVHACGLRPHK